MIAVIASLVVLFYLLVPGGLFRLVTSTSLSLKKFHKTKAQDVTFSILTCLLPFCASVLIAWYASTWPFPTQESLVKRRQSYRTFFQAMISDKRLEESLKIDPAKFNSDDTRELLPFWSATNGVLKRQGRFLAWYYFFVIIEAGFFVWLGKQYKKSNIKEAKKKRWRDRLGSRLLVPIVSEWHVLLTDFGSPGTLERIELDVLTSDGILYRGQLVDYFYTPDGDLSGIVLNRAYRFDRDDYREHKKADLDNAVKVPPITVRFTRDRAEYWREIPGAIAFYIPKERISNINVRQITKPSDVIGIAEKRLAARNMPDYVISPPPSSGPQTPPASSNPPAL